MMFVSNVRLTSFPVPWLIYLFGALVNHCWYGLYTAVCALKKQTLWCIRLVVSQETLTLPFHQQSIKLVQSSYLITVLLNYYYY